MPKTNPPARSDALGTIVRDYKAKLKKIREEARRRAEASGSTPMSPA